ncbi:hypothetical protein SE907_15550, partial [Legionella pneumophila]|nr:hypothetical protein [Legionella pneumophila]MDW9189638.1 hypothetical protein [Legionella pneumophila]
ALGLANMPRKRQGIQPMPLYPLPACRRHAIGVCVLCTAEAHRGSAEPGTRSGKECLAPTAHSKLPD